MSAEGDEGDVFGSMGTTRGAGDVDREFLEPIVRKRGGGSEATLQTAPCGSDNRQRSCSGNVTGLGGKP